MKINLPTGDSINENRFVYSFFRGTKVKQFGPYKNEEEAREAFQRVYGYWPGDCVDVTPYVRDTRPSR